MASLITLEHSLPSLSSSPPTTMATSTSPVMIDKPLVDWDQWDVKTFLNNNKGKYCFDDACVDLIVDQGYTGRGLLSITQDTLVRNGLKLGHAFTFMSLITDLQTGNGYS